MMQWVLAARYDISLSSVKRVLRRYRGADFWGRESRVRRVV
jgi:hypothetical protein